MCESCGTKVLADRFACDTPIGSVTSEDLSATTLTHSLKNLYPLMVMYTEDNPQYI